MRFRKRYARFEVFVVFRVAVPCSVVAWDQRFGEQCCHHLQG